MTLKVNSVEFLILGAGWTSHFLIPLLQRHGITFAATSTTGHDSTIPFKYDPASSSTEPYSHLPSARTVLITFPLKGPNQSTQLTSLYRKVHGNDNRWIQLGSTGIFTAPHWNDHNSSYDKESERAIAEEELLSLDGCVVNLAGLYGEARDPKNWITRVAKSKEDVKKKNALHMIHGNDVAAGIVAVHEHFTPGKRWLLTDLRVYDWWDLMQAWGKEARKRAKETIGEEAESLQFEKWVGELMEEEEVRALPRDKERLGRILDSRGFWYEMGVWPEMGRIG